MRDRSVCLLWHCHQPSYRDALTGEVLLPWVRLHAARAYADMPERLSAVDGARAVFNLTRVLVDGLDAAGDGALDPWEAVAQRPAVDLSRDERRFCIARFFDVQGKAFERHPPYAVLREQMWGFGDPDRAADGASTTDLRDLQVWFHLVWCGPGLAAEPAIRALFEKGSGFREEEKRMLLDRIRHRVREAGVAFARAQEAGAAELTTSPYYHPILPLLCDAAGSDPAPGVSPPLRFPHPEDARTQVAEAVASHERRWGDAPAGLWPSEGGVSPAALAAIAASPLRWIVTDRAILGQSLAAAGRNPEADDFVTPHRVKAGERELAVFFRDTGLSDRIGFVYHGWEDAEGAAADLVAHLEAVPGGETKSDCIMLALDGENAWGYYPEGGKPFLEALYRRLSTHPWIRMRTCSEYLEHAGGVESLPELPGIGTGSWIHGSLGTWAAHPDQREAWNLLDAARDRCGRTAGLDALHLAEGSDGFWWFGDEHVTDLKPTFVRLFTSAIRSACATAGTSEPPGLADWERRMGGIPEPSLETAGDG